MPLDMCKHCQETFDYISNLAPHMKEAHQEFGDKFGCLILRCDYSTKKKNDVREHIAVKHTIYRENIDYM